MDYKVKISLRWFFLDVSWGYVLMSNMSFLEFIGMQNSTVAILTTVGWGLILAAILSGVFAGIDFGQYRVPNLSKNMRMKAGSCGFAILVGYFALTVPFSDSMLGRADDSKTDIELDLLFKKMDK